MRKPFMAVRFVLASIGIYHILSLILRAFDEVVSLPYWLLPVILVPLISLFHALERRFQCEP